MSRDSNGNLVVTWKQVVSILLPTLAAPIGISWSLIARHEMIPAHEGSVRKDEFLALQTDLREVRIDVKHLLEKIR